MLCFWLFSDTPATGPVVAGWQTFEHSPSTVASKLGESTLHSRRNGSDEPGSLVG